MNAGSHFSGASEESSLEEIDRQMHLNFYGVVNMIKAVTPLFLDQKQGRIINISSLGGLLSLPFTSAYNAGKFALEGYAESLRLDLKPFNIGVVIIEPGAIETEFGDVMLQPMLERSGNSAYHKMAEAVARSTRNSFENGDSSPATVISDLISKAIRAGRPKTRYAAGKYARPMMFVRKYFGDRIFDRLIMSQVK